VTCDAVSNRRQVDGVHLPATQSTADPSDGEGERDLASYELTLTEADAELTKAYGDNIFVANLSADYPVYIFYYPSEMPSQQLEQGLRSLGARTGNNLFVNVGGLSDPNFNKITRAFDIKSFPAVVITAVASLAALESENGSAYIRLDKKTLSADNAIDVIEQMYLFFLRGQISEAIKSYKLRTRINLIKKLRDFVVKQLKSLGRYIESRDISVSVIQGKFEIKKSA
jgi:hypothetical protein